MTKKKQHRAHATRQPQKSGKSWVTIALLAFLAFSAGILAYQTLAAKSPSSTPAAHASAPTPTAIPIQNTAPTAAPALPPAPQPAKQAGGTRLVAQYFHATQRCVTCENIEKYAHEAIQQYFAAELEAGVLEFQSIDVMTPAHNHYIRDYSLVSPSLVLVIYEGEQPGKWKNLSEVWQRVSNRNSYFQYVKGEIETMLREVG